MYMDIINCINCFDFLALGTKMYSHALVFKHPSNLSCLEFFEGNISNNPLILFLNVWKVRLKKNVRVKYEKCERKRGLMHIGNLKS